MHALLDHQRADCGRLYVNPNRRSRQFGGQSTHRAIEGGGKQHGLARGRRQRADALDVVDETHIEHAVGLIQHQHLQLRQVDTAAIEVVKQTAGCGNKEVDATRQLAVLYRIRRAAIKTYDTLTHILAVAHGLLSHLLRELARGGQHEYTRLRGHAVLRRGQRRCHRQHVQCGQHKRGGFAGTGLGGANDVAAFEQRRNRLGLNGRRCDIAAGGKCRLEGRSEIQFCKRHDNFPSSTRHPAPLRARRATTVLPGGRAKGGLHHKNPDGERARDLGGSGAGRGPDLRLRHVRAWP